MDMAMLFDVDKQNAQVLCSTLGIPEKCALSAAIVFRNEKYGKLESVKIDGKYGNSTLAYLNFDTGIFYASFGARGNLGVVYKNGPQGEVAFARRQ